MKKFKYKLEAVLKLRTIREDQCKYEIAKLQNTILQKKSQIETEEYEISLYYKESERHIIQTKSASGVEFYSQNIMVKKNKIKNILSDIGEIEKLVVNKYEELAQLKADVKVIEKLKEKSFAAFKKDLIKQENLKNEEQVMLWLANRKLQGQLC